MSEILLIIDGNSLMYRGFHALPLLSSGGTYTNAIQGFMGMLLKVLAEKNPTYCTVAFDEHGPTFRHEIYEAYKAGRRPMPQELIPQFPLIKELLTDMGIGVISLAGYEADDILGTFAKQGEEQGVMPLLLTGDKDALQLVTPQTHVLFTKKGITETVEFDPQTLYDYFGVWPSQVTDWKGLMGDSSDNIPGVPGVGEKTATKLLTQYQSLDNLYDHSEEIKGKLGEKIRANKELAYFSKELSQINKEVPLALNLKDIKLENLKEGIPFFQKYQMKQMERRLLTLLKEGEFGGLPQISWNEAVNEGKNTEELQEIQWVSVTTLEQVKMWGETLAKEGEPVALTLGEKLTVYQRGSGQGMEVSFAYSLLEEGLIPQEVLAFLLPEIAKLPMIVHDGKSFFHLCNKHGLCAPNQLLWDTMVGAYLLNPQEKSYGFSALYPELEEHAHNLYGIYISQKESLEKQNMLELMNTIELPLINVLYQMEKRGFQVDTEVLHQLGEYFNQEINLLTEGIYDAVGVRDFNINSPQQLGNILFETLKLPGGKKKKTGYSTSAQVLENLIGVHPSIEMILSYRQVTKLNSTYIEGLLKLVGDDGRIHSTFEQTGTATGRISSSEPNLQNIPVRTKQGREIRKAFIPRKDWVLIDADYSQIELRVLAHLSQDEAMMEAFVLGQDIHTRTAAEVYGVTMEQVSDQMRASAKAVNFGLVYGISDFGLARNIGIGVKEAGDFIQTYFTKYPGVRRYMDDAVQEGKKLGYTHTMLGRRRYLPELTNPNYNIRSFGERIAMNAPIQGTAADIIKKAMVCVERLLKEEGMAAKLILQVHDELLLESPLEEVEKASKLLKETMENVVTLRVPLVADVNYGQNWYETK
ncbi:MAG: DNA polymerase I [Clostridiales bacterium]|nr:DNA polymerase I [Clostridiales bacterium]